MHLERQGRDQDVTLFKVRSLFRHLPVPLPAPSVFPNNDSRSYGRPIIDGVKKPEITMLVSR
eukprot:872231-Amphidinium_carterae.1